MLPMATSRGYWTGDPCALQHTRHAMFGIFSSFATNLLLLVLMLIGVLRSGWKEAHQQGSILWFLYMQINVDHKDPSTRLIGACHQHQGSSCARALQFRLGIASFTEDPISQIVFFDEAMKVLESKPSTTFWAALARSLEKQTRDGAKNSTFLQQTLSSGYPKLLRLFHDFFSKIAAHTDTVYTQDRQSPETVLVLRDSLRAFSTFEALYLSRTSNKMNESSSLDLLLTRTDGLVIRDQIVTLLTRPAATPEHSSDGYVIMGSSVIDMMAVYGRITGPILTATKSESSAIIAKLHRESARSADPPSDMGGSSAYVKELTEKLAFVKSEVLARLSIEDVTREWPLDIVRHVLRTFVLHVSIVKPLDETRKLQLTGDMTELEFALGKRKHGGGGLDAAGSEYRALRALRPLLFLETARLAEPGATAGLPAGGAAPHTHARSDPAAAYFARVAGGRILVDILLELN
ncbi:hypothetical protein BJV78DRAFT_1362418 [Lactifluus subvellereus]|nr:hypothetical protein BJV78DRAFT_1362418 [Lactifluus subvellereus]